MNRHVQLRAFLAMHGLIKNADYSLMPDIILYL
jgi:hypothetical protein